MCHKLGLAVGGVICGGKGSENPAPSTMGIFPEDETTIWSIYSGSYPVVRPQSPPSEGPLGFPGNLVTFQFPVIRADAFFGISSDLCLKSDMILFDFPFFDFEVWK